MNPKRIAIALLALAAFPTACLANATIPGPLMHFGAMNTGLGIWWPVLSMLTCTILEGTLLHATHVFKRPYLASAQLNGLSLSVRWWTSC